ncbi:MAG TPA: hypothetical protein VFC07_04970 [Verrucomicrobiae bacterium]|nr:hypothetical protein [Verrucomicrobiae bacterium]
MSDPLNQRIRELSWHQQLTKEEEAEVRAYLGRHPQAREEVAVEERLTRLLERIPQAPKVASNFTAQVMQAIEREKAAAHRKAAEPSVGAWWRSWLPRVALAGAAGLVAMMGYHEHQVHQRTLMAERVQQVAEAFSGLGREPVEHFEPISRIAEEPPAADTELSSLVASMK